MDIQNMTVEELKQHRTNLIDAITHNRVPSEMLSNANIALKNMNDLIESKMRVNDFIECLKNLCEENAQ